MCKTDNFGDFDNIRHISDTCIFGRPLLVEVIDKDTSRFKLIAKNIVEV